MTSKSILVLSLLLIFLMGSKRRVDSRNDNRTLKRKAAALMKKKLAEAHAKMKVLESQRLRKANNRLDKFRASVRERLVSNVATNHQ